MKCYWIVSNARILFQTVRVKCMYPFPNSQGHHIFCICKSYSVRDISCQITNAISWPFCLFIINMYIADILCHQQYPHCIDHSISDYKTIPILNVLLFPKSFLFIYISFDLNSSLTVAHRPTVSFFQPQCWRTILALWFNSWVSLFHGTGLTFSCERKPSLD